MKKIICSVTFAFAATSAFAELPILGWYGIPHDKVTVGLYRQAKDAGFTHLMQNAPDRETALKLLDCARDAGIRLLLVSPCLSGEKLEENVRAFKDHPGLGLYYLRDEPSVAQMPPIGATAKRIMAIDSVHPCYVNWFGGIEAFENPSRWYGAPDLRTYIEASLKDIPVQLMSFDTYAVRNPDPNHALQSAYRTMKGAEIKPIWFETLELVREFSRARKIPFWAFSLATAHPHGTYTYPTATVASMKLQQYANLAYGAQGLQYFTFWGSAKNGEAPMQDGLETYVMDRVRAVNAEIRARSFVFEGADAADVWHAGSPLPPGTHPLPKCGLPQGVLSLEADGGMIVSHLVNGSHEYLMVVNRELFRELVVKTRLSGDVMRVRADGKVTPAAQHLGEYVLLPGEAEIFQIR